MITLINVHSILLNGCVYYICSVQNKQHLIKIIMKVTVVGAGAVGASCAEYIAIKNFASEVVLLDIKENLLKVKQWI